MPLKILQLVTARQRRGAEVFATSLSDALVAKGHDVMVVGLFPPPSDPLIPDRADTADVLSTSESRLDLRRLWKLLAIIDDQRPDVVQANGSQTLKYSVLAKRLSSRRFPVIYRNISIASTWVRNRVHRAWGSWLARSLDHVTSVSEESSRDFGETYGVPDDRRTVIRRGIAIPPVIERDAARRMLESLIGVRRDARILVHIGSFSEEKNHGWLIDRFHTLRTERKDIHLVLIGDGALRAAVERRVVDCGLERSVHLLGVRSDAAGLVAGADILVLPSRIEGIPGVVLEAAAQTVPAVATNVGGMPEAIIDGRTGLLVAPGDARAFVAAVQALLEDEPRRRAMGRAAHELVKERFSMEETAAEFEHLYTRLIDESSR